MHVRAPRLPQRERAVANAAIRPTLLYLEVLLH